MTRLAFAGKWSPLSAPDPALEAGDAEDLAPAANTSLFSSEASATAPSPVVLRARNAWPTFLPNDRSRQLEEKRRLVAGHLHLDPVGRGSCRNFRFDHGSAGASP